MLLCLIDSQRETVENLLCQPFPHLCHCILLEPEALDETETYTAFNGVSVSLSEACRLSVCLSGGAQAGMWRYRRFVISDQLFSAALRRG